jgi:hypothetical protein
MIATTTTAATPMSKRQETAERHTPASIEHVAAQLDRMVTSLRISVGMLNGTPKINEIHVRYERSLRDGLRFLELWCNEVKSVASDERLEASKKPAK